MSAASFNIVILISGEGSNLQAIIDRTRACDTINIQAVISNKATAYGLQRAHCAGIPTGILAANGYSSREQYDAALIQLIEPYQPDLVVLAGFMRILSPHFVNHFANKIINIHPSLLPKYKGLHTHQRALDAGDAEHGCSIHFVSDKLDGGTIITQSSCAVSTDDTVASLQQKVHQLEHELYPQVIFELAQQHLAAGK